MSSEAPETDLTLLARSVEATNRSWALARIFDGDLCFAHVNNAFEQLTGHLSEAVVGRPLSVLEGLRTDPAAVEDLRYGVKGARPVLTTLLLYRRDGTTFWAEVSLSPIADGQDEATYFVAVYVDVTSQVMAQRDLEAVYKSEREARRREQATARRLQALLSQMPSAVVVADAPSGRLVGVNDQAVAIWGDVLREVETVESLAGFSGQRGDGTTYQAHEWPLSRALLGVMTVDEEAVITRADSSEGIISMRATPVLDDSHEVVAAILMFDDVTDRKRAERALAESQERAAALAHQLQRSLLPAKLPTPPKLQFGAAFVPVGEGLEVGGDFYDVFEQRDGDWVAVIGDVMGKGVDAAAVTSLARHVLRTTALRSRRVATLLQMLNEALCREGEGHPFATVAAAMFVEHDLGFRMTIGLAGHPKPFLVRADGSVEKVGREGTLSGVVDDVTVHEEEVLVGSGDLLVLYTDGVTEARNPHGSFLGENGLHNVLEQLTAEQRNDAQAVADGIRDAVVDFCGGPFRDDLAVLVCRVTRR